MILTYHGAVIEHQTLNRLKLVSYPLTAHIFAGFRAILITQPYLSSLTCINKYLYTINGAHV